MMDTGYIYELLKNKYAKTFKAYVNSLQKT